MLSKTSQTTRFTGDRFGYFHLAKLQPLVVIRELGAEFVGGTLDLLLTTNHGRCYGSENLFRRLIYGNSSSEVLIHARLFSLRARCEREH